MAVTVETLDKLERKISLSLPAAEVANEAQNRLKRLSRQVRIDGFRPGKVPMRIVQQRYGLSVHYEVLQDKVNDAFTAAVREAQLRVAGAPRISEKSGEGAADGAMVFDAVFEVYPEVRLGDLAGVEVERASTEVTDEAIDKTIEILRKQRRTFFERGSAGAPAELAAADGDRVTIDFEGKIEGEPFEGGKAEGYQFILGEGRMLEAFERAVRGMKAGESKTFPLKFPDDYHGQEVAGKEADFLVTLRKVEWPQLPEVNDEFAKALGIADGSVAALREDIRQNLQREVKFRVLARNKAAAMDALAKVAELDLPQALVQDEVERLTASARADLKQRGVKDADTAPIPADLFKAQAERRVRLGLVVAELVKQHGLDATDEQLRKHVQEMAQSYEKPEEVMRWYLGDRERMAEIRAVVLENNVTEFVLGKAKVVDKALPFDDLMTPNA